MSQPSPYDSNPHLRGTPIRIDEVEALVYAGAKPLLKNQEALLHFIDRVASALKDARSTQDTLRNELELANMRRQASGHPLEVARQALAALDESQMRALLDAGYWEALDELNNEKDAYEHTQLVMVNALRKVRFTLSSLLENPELPDAVRASIQQAVESLPTPPPPATRGS